MILGSGYYFVVDNKKSKIAFNNQQAKRQDEAIQKEQSLSDESKNEPLSKKEKDVVIKNNLSKKNVDDNLKSGTERNVKDNVEKLAELNNKNVEENRTAKISLALKTKKEKSFSNKQKLFNNTEKEFARNNNPEKSKSEIIISNKEIHNNISETNEKKTVDDSALNKTANAVIDNKKKDPEDKTSQTDSAATKKIVKADAKQKKSSAWKIGFVVEPGVSSIHQSLFKTSNINAYSSPTNLPNTPPTATYYQPSEIKSGFSFAAGLSINKILSKRIMFSTGINYHYYSSKIFTGNYVDSSTYLYSPSGVSFPANSYYKSGSTNAYINHYHFIELPVTFNFELNKNVKFPLLFEAGFSALYLLNSNALNFDSYKGAYYKDNGQFNKMQFNAASACMIGFQVGKNQLQVGPQLQYGLTGLLKKSENNSEHLFVAGLKISFTLNKK